MIVDLPVGIGPAVARGARRERGRAGDGALLGPFVGGRSPEPAFAGDETAGPHQSPMPRALADSMGEVADRLERIAGALRNTAPAGTLARVAEGRDALELLITAFALGYHDGCTRAPAVDPPPDSS